ncbi:hypothetical protein GQ42DRAFT_166020 [Ramicandelaber brevisporus]|nr:hypothetical protein GQ42DRAFT_166020 [Ramicandelaber brevisporus]
MDAVPLPRQLSDSQATRKEWEYRRVLVAGRFLHDREILLGPRTRDGRAGYQVITPLLRTDVTPKINSETGEAQPDIVLVNRGWIPAEKSEQSTRPSSLVDGAVAIFGMLRYSEPVSRFAAGNSPDRNQWMFIDVDEMSRRLGSLPLFVDAVALEETGEDTVGTSMVYAQKGIPMARSDHVTLRNKHQEYLMMWYALSLATGAMALQLYRKGAKGRVGSAMQMRRKFYG